MRNFCKCQVCIIHPFRRSLQKAKEATAAAVATVSVGGGGGDDGEEDNNSENEETLTKTLPSILLSSPHFNAVSFLTQVHAETSFAALLRGYETLQASVSQRSDTLKELVKQNFDRFVNAKNAIELVYADMRTRGLASGDHGTRRSIDAAMDAFQRAQYLFQPLLARSQAEEGIRRRLAALERYDVVFGLGAKTERALLLGEFQSVVYEYKRAKAVIAGLQANQSHLLERFWTGHLARQLGLLREELFGKLANPIFSYEVYAKLIGYLTALDAQPDPIVFYFEARRNALLAAIKHQTGLTASADHRQIDGGMWAESMANLLCTFMVSFSKFATSLMEGRLNAGSSAPSSGGMKKKEGDLFQHQKRIAEFAENLGEALEANLKATLGPESKASSDCRIANAEAIMPEIGRIVYCVQSECSASQTAALEPVHRVLLTFYRSALTRLVSVRWAWVIEESRTYGLTEQWDIDGLENNPNDDKETGDFHQFATTLFRKYQGFLMRQLSLTGQMVQVYQSKSVLGSIDLPAPSLPVERWLVKSILVFLQSLHAMMVSEEEADNPQINSNKVSLPKLGHGYRLLTLLSNLLYLRQHSLPRLIAAYGETNLNAPHPTSLSESAVTELYAAVTSLDASASHLYLNLRHSPTIDELVHRGFGSSNDWQGAATSKVRPWVLSLLLHLLSVQTEICDVSQMLLRPLMTELVTMVFQTILTVLRDTLPVPPAPPISMGAYLQARLDLAFLSNRLVTVSSGGELEEEIQRVLDAALPAQHRPDEADLLGVKLLQAEQTTQLMFSCFQYT